ncbi:MAG: trypsin-like peptidase domain-containing protein [Planctomycetota bacterium]|nr:trypsin-like peptidase domain-containing protein [Planctomycetota bacterium]
MRRVPLLLLLCGAVAADVQDLQSRVFHARDRVLPALVNVQVVTETFQGGRRRQMTAGGSGVVVSADGLVVTNFHVAGHAKKVFCTLADKTRVRAELLGGDPSTDLAVLRLDLKEIKRLGGSFKVATLGRSEGVQVGDFVIALGSPFGLTASLTSGVISNTERYLSSSQRLPTGEPTGMFNNWIQTDAAINPGNSGGPLVNLSGEVIGINTRAITGDGLGFAIPVDTVKRVYTQIVAHGSVVRSWIGVDRGLEPLGLESEVRGVRVGHVDEGSPAAKAGLRPGDIIQAIAGKPVEAVHLDQIASIRSTIADAPLGKPLTLRVRRGEETVDLSAVTERLGALKLEYFDARRFGLTARPVTERFARQRGLKSTAGVVITGVTGGGPAAAADLQAGDIILKVQRKSVESLQSFRKLYREIQKDMPEKVLVSIQRGQARMFRALTPSKKDEEDDE